MKTPIQVEPTLGIMMSGESPTPVPHGEHRYEAKDLPIGSPNGAQLNSTPSMLDKEVQYSREDLSMEPPLVKSCLPETIALKEMNPNLHPSTAKANGGERCPMGNHLERMEKADEILPSPAELDAKPKGAKLAEEIETMDQTDARPIVNVDKNQKHEQEDSCLVDCLYYVDQCCECRIL